MWDNKSMWITMGAKHSSQQSLAEPVALQLCPPGVLLSVCDELCHAKNPLQGGVDKPPCPGHHVWITAHVMQGARAPGVFPGLLPQNCFSPFFEGGRREKQRRFLSQL